MTDTVMPSQEPLSATPLICVETVETVGGCHCVPPLSAKSGELNDEGTTRLCSCPDTCVHNNCGGKDVQGCHTTNEKNETTCPC
jgi:hypothetical protein